MADASLAIDSAQQWLAKLSRGIRGPLTSVIGYAELLADEGFDEDTARSFGREIRDSGLSVLRCFEEFIEYLYLLSDGFSPHPRDCNISQLLDRLSQNALDQAEEAGLTWKCRQSPELSTQFRIDDRLLEQILSQIIRNALHYTKHGGVELDATWTDNKLQFRVWDTGPGIRPDLQRGLFDLFSPAAKQTGIETGPGLGLALARTAARQLHGDVQLESSDERGSCFLVEIPAKFSDADSKQQRQQRRRPKQMVKDSLRGRRVLVVDDNPSDQRLLEFVLKKQGAKVSIAGDGKQAVQKTLASDLFFDLILMDMEMPVLSGYEATSELRHLGHSGPIIALTANSQNKDRQRCIEAGCNGFLTKPIRQKDLVQTIHSVLTGR